MSHKNIDQTIDEIELEIAQALKRASQIKDDLAIELCKWSGQAHERKKTKQGNDLEKYAREFLDSASKDKKHIITLQKKL